MLVDDGTQGLSYKVIGIAIGVHRKYGPGLLENAYLRPLVIDLRAAGHKVDCQPVLPLVHSGVTIDRAYRPDAIVNGRLVLELKVVAALLEMHRQQTSPCSDTESNACWQPTREAPSWLLRGSFVSFAVLRFLRAI
jgi:GxxExxY protein